MTTAFLPYVLGTPGMRSSLSAEMRRVLANPSPQFFPGNRWINGLLSRDVGNTPYIDCLRAGLVMGPVTASGYYANAFVGTLTNAEAQGSTQIEVSAVSATEIVRRIGASGTLTLTGPPAASGVVRSVTATYSAVNTATGAITISALGANQVEQINLNVASTAGNLKLNVQLTDGTFVTTGNAAYDAADATYLSNINTALDAATGVVGGIVASAIPTLDTDLGIRLTYSGTGYAGLPWTNSEVALFPTSSTAAIYTAITTGVDGRLIAGSFVGSTDGSQVPTLLLTDGPAMPVTNLTNLTGVNPLEFPQIPIAGTILTAYVIDWPTDTSLKTWLREKLSTLAGPKFTFDDAF